jgi:predicted ester cyclase
MPLDKSTVADAYVRYLEGHGERLLSLFATDALDHVSGQTGAEIWSTVGAWLQESFADVTVDLHSVAQDDEARVLVWVTLHGTHVGSAFPWMRDRRPSGRRVAWQQLHVFRTQGDSITEHWAVRDDLRVLDAIDRAD